MKFIVRHQISELEEEVYEFVAHTHFITYDSFWKSSRKDTMSPFGYDWKEYYKDTILEETRNLTTIFDEDFDRDIIEDLEDKIYNRYNPIIHGFLYGSSGGDLLKRHPPKVDKETILNHAIQAISRLEVKI